MAEEFDFIVVGSGAGGGPVAANLASAGFEVLLLEAGDIVQGENYAVPAFHGQATQDPSMRWDFWVRHYEDLEQQKKDSKYYESYNGEQVDGVLYPRASTLGGCTAHNAMITVYPHNRDWEKLEALTGDPAWNPDNMRRYFQRLERCEIGVNPPAESRRGTSGWLATSFADPFEAIGDHQLFKLILSAAISTLADLLSQRPGGSLELAGQLFMVKQLMDELDQIDHSTAAGKQKARILLSGFQRYLDPNDYSATTNNREGLFLVPLAVNNGVRNGSRERILQAKRDHPDKLTIRANAFVTRVLIDEATATAVGVEYRQGNRLYQAAPAPKDGRPQPGNPLQVRAKREVILSGGAFNTPQLLMLSGMGPQAQLEEFDIQPAVKDRFWEGVGQNLQDRYEVSVISETTKDFTILGDSRFRGPNPSEEPDAALQRWRDTKQGLYTSNGAAIAIIRRSAPDLPEPDLFIFGLPAFFRGYFPEYDDRIVEDDARNRFSWAILKGHTRNRGGKVTLKTADPFERPDIQFHYFDEGTDCEGDDLRAVLEGVKIVRDMMLKPSLAKLVTKAAIQPAPSHQEIEHPIDLDADGELNEEELGQWIKNEAWGHHACGTCQMGPDDGQAVVDGRFRVHGVKNLRIVDASVFPEIPGFFIVSAIYMIAEKASEQILQDHGQQLPEVAWTDLDPDYWKA